MRVPTLDSLMEEHRKKTITTTQRYSSYSSITRLSQLLGLYSALSPSAGRGASVITFAKELLECYITPVETPYVLQRDNWKPDTKRPKIYLVCDKTKRGNLTINFGLLEIGFDRQGNAYSKTLESLYNGGGVRPAGELAIVREFEYIHSIADGTRFTIPGNSGRSETFFLEACIAQQCVEIVPLLVEKYVEELSKDCEVWVKNKIDFHPIESKENFDYTGMIQKFPHGQLIQNLFDNDYIKLKNIQYEYVSFSDILDKPYHKLEVECLQKIQNIEKLNQKMSFYGLTDDILVDKIKKQRSHAGRVVEGLNANILPPREPITEELLKKWIDDLFKIDPEDTKARFLDKPPFIDETAPVVQTEKKIKEVPQAPLVKMPTLQNKISTVRNTAGDLKRKSIGSKIEDPNRVSIFKRNKAV